MIRIRTPDDFPYSVTNTRSGADEFYELCVNFIKYGILKEASPFFAARLPKMNDFYFIGITYDGRPATVWWNADFDFVFLSGPRISPEIIYINPFDYKFTNHAYLEVLTEYKKYYEKRISDS